MVQFLSLLQPFLLLLTAVSISSELGQGVGCRMNVAGSITGRAVVLE